MWQIYLFIIKFKYIYFTSSKYAIFIFDYSRGPKIFPPVPFKFKSDPGFKWFNITYQQENNLNFIREEPFLFPRLDYQNRE